jgi:hypothetical protein
MDTLVADEKSRIVPRSLERIKRQDFQGFGCSDCNWKFNPSSELSGDSLDEMKRRYEAERDKEFAAHTCIDQKRPTNQITKQIGRG